jgi:peptidyl-prolyl cis-trans isomerase B (cyclophilin B)
VKEGFKYTAKMSLSNGKELEIEFDSKKAPYKVSNFLHLARNKFYDGVVFHRVIANFVVQGGDPTGTGTGGPGYKFDNEDNDLKHLRGSLSMAHAGRNTNGSQFFIVLAPQPHLNGLHTVFGTVTKGQEFLDEISQGTKMNKVEVFEEAL